VTSKARESEAMVPPSEQVTIAVDVPGFVLVPTFHVQEAWPVEPATG